MARRVNKKFLIIITSIIMGGVGVALIFPWLLNRRNAALYIAEGERCFNEGKFPEARDAYAKALSSQRTPDLYVKYGDVFHELARFDDDAIDKDRRQWEEALNIDPAYRPAHERLFAAALDRIEILPTADSFDWLRKKAEDLAKVEPDNVRARVMIEASTIGAWLARKPTSTTDVKKAIDNLKAFQAINPEMWEIPWYTSQAAVRQMQDSTTAMDRDSFKSARDNALAVFDAALETQGNNPAILYRYYRFKNDLNRTGSNDPADYRNDGVTKARLKALLAQANALIEPADKAPKEYADYVSAHIAEADKLQQQGKLKEAEEAFKALLTSQLLVKANAVVKPEDKDYVDIRVQTANVLWQDQKPGDAEKILQGLLAERPNDESVRLSVARLFRGLTDANGKTRRPEAIELLARPMADDPSLKGYRAYHRRLQEFSRLTELAQADCDAYGEVDAEVDKTNESASEKERIKKQTKDQLKEQINACYARAQTLRPDQDPTMLKLRGRILLLEKDHLPTLEAIRYLQQALDKTEQAGMMDRDLMLLLSRVYLQVNQTGEAISLLERVVERVSDPYLRKDLARLLLSTGQPEKAKLHVDALVKQLPKDEDVMSYQVLTAFFVNKIRPSAELKKEYRDALLAMLQDTPERQMRKARVALNVEEWQVGESLLLPLADNELKNQAKGPFPANELLARLYYAQGKEDPKDDATRRAATAVKRAAAQAIATACLAKDPDDNTFKLLAKLFDGKLTKEEIALAQNEEIDRTVDPMQQALQRYGLARSQRKFDEALKFLLDAEKLSSDNGGILENIFNLAIDTRNWALAETYAGKLGKLNWDDADGLFYRTRLLLATNEAQGAAADKDKRAAALSSAQALTRQIPHLSKSWLLLGQAQQAVGQTDAAIVSFGKVRDRELYNSQALMGLVECYLTKGQLDLARKMIEVGRKSDAAAAFVEVDKQIQEQSDPASVTLQRETDLDNRVKELKAAGQQDPALQDAALLKYYLALIDNYNQVIRLQGTQKTVDLAKKARDRIDEAMNRWPDEMGVYDRLRYLSELTGNAQEAVAIIKKQLLTREQWRDRHEPLILLGLLYQSMGTKSLPDAEQAYQQAVSIGKNKAPEIYLLVRQQLTRFYIQTKQVDKAVALLSQLADETKELAYRRQIVQVLLANDRAEDAEKILSDALAANPADTSLLNLMTSMKLSRRQYDGPGGARELVDRLLKADPQDASALCYRGMIHVGQGELKEALTDLERANGLRPGNPDIMLQLANVYIQRHQTDDAIRMLESVVQSAPARDSKPARLRLLQLYKEQDRWAAVETLLKDTQANDELKGDVGWLKLESDMWVARGDYQKAIDRLSKAMEMAPDNEDVGYALLELLLRLKQYDTVISISDKVVAAERPWWVHMSRGAALVGKNGKSKEAESEFDQALDGVDVAQDDIGASSLVETMANSLGLQATSEKVAARVMPRWLLQRAMLHLTRQDWPAAAAAADQMLAEGLPKYGPNQRLTALKTAGQAYIAAAAAHVPDAGKKGEQAYTDYLKEVENQHLGIASQLEALNNIAYLFTEQLDPPDYPKALVYSKKAYDLMDRANFFDPNIGDTHGWILVLSNQLDEGVRILQRAVGTNAPPPDAFYHLGRAYLKKSQPDDAQSSLQKAMEIVEARTKAGQFVDPGLKERIVKAQEEARQMKPVLGEAK